MLKAYVGIARPDGLVCLLPDREECCLAVKEWAACFWAVIADDVAEQVAREMQAGDSRLQALRVLDAMASEIRPLVRD